MSVSWTVHTQDTEVSLSGLEVVLQLITKGMQAERPSHEEMVRVLVGYLQDQGALAQCTPQQLALVAFDLGYFYKIFLQNNNVTTEIKNVEEERNEIPGDPLQGSAG